jgi:cobalt/nickel transport system ATP-binding protein
MNGPLIEFRDVDFAYSPGAAVLRGCGFCLRPGERLALRGSNGCGKTTLLHLIVGLLRPDGGQITIFDQPRKVEADFHDVRRRVGLLFQDADDQLFCPTVAEDVAFGPLNLGKPRGEVRRIVAATLDSLGLSGYEQRVTYRLSGGEKRLVALATVLAMQPDVLLLDEPSGGLDDEATERLIGLLARLPQAMIIASHDRAFADAVTTSAAELQQGKVVAEEERRAV